MDTMNKDFAILLSLSIFFLTCYSFTSVFGQTQDLSLLMKVKRSFVQDSSTEDVLHDWSPKTNPNFCNWTGVGCGLISSTANSVHVVSLNLSGFSLCGSISPSLGRLQNLLHLDLSSNRLTGPIPTTLSNLSSLESLLLFSNQLSGPIPPQLGSLNNLRVMRIGDNGLTGPIPSTFGNLVNLVALGLASCHLTGSIPLNWVTFPDLRT